MLKMADQRDGKPLSPWWLCRAPELVNIKAPHYPDLLLRDRLMFLLSHCRKCSN